MRTEVEVKLIIQHRNDDEYQKYMEDIRMKMMEACGVRSVDIGVGYETEDEE